MVDWSQVALGAFVLWVPGLALAWAFLPRLDWAKFLVVSVIAALTVPPALLYVLNVFFGVRLTPLNEILLSLSVACLAAAKGLIPALDRRWA